MINTLSEQCIACAAVVTLYFPAPQVFKNIRRWSDQVDTVYVVDNSDQPAADTVESLRFVKNLVYMPQHENKGVATALNIGARRALSEGYSWLLTMDQDSVVEANHVAGLLNAVSGEEARVAVVAPFCRLSSNQGERRVGVYDVDTVMTSGCLVNLAIYQAIGPFLEDLFIDCVDDEYCLRARSANYRVLQCHDIGMEHTLGDMKGYSYRGRTVYVSNHSWLRRYYITRNKLFVIRLYQAMFPGLCSDMRNTLRGDLKGIVLFEDDKLRKLVMMLRGWYDFHRKRMGKRHV